MSTGPKPRKTPKTICFPSGKKNSNRTAPVSRQFGPTPGFNYYWVPLLSTLSTLQFSILKNANNFIRNGKRICHPHKKRQKNFYHFLKETLKIFFGRNILEMVQNCSFYRTFLLFLPILLKQIWPNQSFCAHNFTQIYMS